MKIQIQQLPFATVLTPAEELESLEVVDMLVTAGGFKHDRGSMVIEIYILRLLRVKNDDKP